MSQKYAVLGLLNISPMTGYLIKKNLELSMHKFWPISYGGLYPALHNLAKEDLVRVDKQEGNRGQILYHITDEGKKELERWLLSSNTSVQTKDEYLLKIFLSKDLIDEERKGLISQYIENKQKLLEELNELAQKENQELYDQQSANLVTEYTIMTLEYEIKLLQGIIKDGKLSK